MRKKLAKRCIEITRKLHSIGIEHGDLYPSNFMLSDHQVYVIDFGGASFFDPITESANFDLGPLGVTLTCLYYNISDWDSNIFKESDTLKDMDTQVDRWK